MIHQQGKQSSAILWGNTAAMRPTQLSDDTPAGQAKQSQSGWDTNYFI
jgi:hypothetical protein